jgi:hypothetical protein
MKTHQARLNDLKGRFLLRNEQPPQNKGALGAHLLAQSAMKGAVLVPVTRTPFGDCPALTCAREHTCLKNPQTTAPTESPSRHFRASVHAAEVAARRASL